MRKNYESEPEIEAGLFKKKDRTFRCHGTGLYVMCETVSTVSWHIYTADLDQRKNQTVFCLRLTYYIISLPLSGRTVFE